MLQSIDTKNRHNESIDPFPVLAISERESEFSIFDTYESSSPQPEVRLSGQPFSIIVHPFGHNNDDKISGLIQWRITGQNNWNEEPLEKLASNKWKGSWTPPSTGTYEWNIEIWSGQKSPLQKCNDHEGVRILKVERHDLMGASWYQLNNDNLSSLDKLPTVKSKDVFLLPTIFPCDEEGLIGKSGKGHYSINTKFTDTMNFGQLTHKILKNRITLGMRIPMKCSPQHPFLISDPDNFNNEGVNDLVSEGWELRRKKWEQVFRYWIVQGIEIFSIPEITCFPLSFWDHIIGTLKKDFSFISFITEENLSDDLYHKMLSAGFSDFKKPIVNIGSKTSSKKISKISKPSQSTELNILACKTDDPEIKVSVKELTNAKFILNFQNENSSKPRTIKISIEHESIQFSNKLIYYARDLSNARAYRWSGKSNDIFLEKGQTELQLLVELNN